MALKFKYKSKEEVPAEHQSLYVERDGAFVLDADGAVDALEVEGKIAALESERDTAKQEGEALKARVTELESINHWAGSNSSYGLDGARPSSTLNNPFRKETFNLTRQCELMQRAPAKGRALATAAGIRLNAKTRRLVFPGGGEANEESD